MRLEDPAVVIPLLRGRYITIEGAECSGKTTCVNRLRNLCVQHAGEDSIVVVREPGATSVGEQIRNILLHNTDDIDPLVEVMLFTSARVDIYKKVIIPALQAGKTVLSDRSLLSTLAYQSKTRTRDGVPWRDIENITHTCLNLLPIPRLYPTAFILDIDLETMRARMKSTPDRIERKSDEYHLNVIDAYRGLSGPYNAELINARDPHEEVFNRLLAAMIRALR